MVDHVPFIKAASIKRKPLNKTSEKVMQQHERRDSYSTVKTFANENSAEAQRAQENHVKGITFG